MSDAAFWERARGLFEDLADQDVADAEARLEALASAEPALAAEVRALLAADRGPDQLPVLRIDVGEPSGQDPLIGRRIGPWSVTAKIGEGGMGRVYRAARADDRFERLVAIKILRGAVDSPRFRERFRAERRILAGLDHPGIARLLDGGELEEGTPYLVLEFVEGTDLIRHATERRLDLRERLQLFRQVLDGVGYAHRHLVVHRDLKPSNILVTPQGETKLLDFGVARLTAASSEEGGPSLAATQDRMFTPAYASPEQLQGEPVSTSSDIYSLGVVLFELLVGATPFVDRRDSPLALSQAIERKEPARPSRAVRRVRKEKPADYLLAPGALQGDLDAIVLKALRREPELRYSSVAELDRDLENHLVGRPVSARRGTIAYVTSRFVRRNRWRLGIATAALAILALAGVQSATRLRTERDLAERRFSETRELARSLLFEIHDAVRDVDGSTEARKLILERALTYLEKLQSESQGDPTLTREVAEGYLRIGEILSDRRAAAGLDLAEQSGTLLQTARELVEPLAQSSGSIESRRLLIRILGALARRRFAGELEPEARLEAAERAVAIAESIVAEVPGSAEDQIALAASLRDNVDLLGFSAKVADAAPRLERAVEASRRALQLSPGLRAAEVGMVDTELLQANVMFRMGRREEALAALRSARERLEQFELREPSSVEIRDRLATTLAHLGSDAWQNGQPREGSETLARSCQLLAVITEADPANHQAARRLTSARTELALAMIADGRDRAAFAEHGDAIEALQRAAERPGAPAFLVYERAFLASQLGKAAGISSLLAHEPSERERRRALAIRWYREALRLFREGESAGVPSHLEPTAWESVLAAATELGVR